MAKSKVAVLRTKPDTVLEDYQRLCELAGLRNALDQSATTILKDNISWHLMYPGSNTTPWQLEGTILALQDAGLDDLVDVHNKTVVTIADLGDRYNKFGPVLEKYGVPKKYNFNPGDMVLSPFAGIGSEGYISVKFGRRFTGIELKRTYWEQSLKFMRQAEQAAVQGTLFAETATAEATA